MRCKYLPQDLTARLDDSVCRYRGEPVYVRVNGDRLRLFDLTNMQKWKWEIIYTDPEFDISSPLLGYMNTDVINLSNNKCYYVRRKPVRRYKQGFNLVASTFSMLDGTLERKRDISSLMYSKGMKECITGVYPTLDQVLDFFKKNFKPGETLEAAVTREIALQVGKNGVVNVFYKEFEVGWMTLKENVVHIPSGDWAWVISKFMQPLNWRVD